MDVSTILRAKGGSVFSVKPDSLVSEAITIMNDRRIGAVLVMEEEGAKVEGILSERDVIRLMAEQGCESFGVKVSDIMTTELLACTSDCTVDSIITGMTKHRVRHLPVFKDKKLMGLISARDVMHYRIRQLEAGDQPRFHRWFPKGKVYHLED